MKELPQPAKPVLPDGVQNLLDMHSLNCQVGVSGYWRVWRRRYQLDPLGRLGVDIDRALVPTIASLSEWIKEVARFLRDYP